MEPDPGARGRLGYCAGAVRGVSGWGMADDFLPFFDNNANGTFKRLIPAKTIQLADGTERLAATVYDLMLSQYGIGRATASSMQTDTRMRFLLYPGLAGKITGVKPSVVVQIAREFAQNSLETGDAR